MKLDEIIEMLPRNEYHDQYRHYFNKATVISTDIINGYDLKRNKEDDDLYYGLFDKNDLIAYFHLVKVDTYYQVSMISVSQSHRGQGLATYLFDYAVLSDNLTVASDTKQTPEAKEVWRALVRNNRYKIYHYNLNTKKKTPVKRQNNNLYPNPWDDTEDTVLITEELTSNQTDIILENFKKRFSEKRKETWYGPGTSSALIWNP